MALDRFRHHRKNPDYVYIGAALFLVLFGLMMISSSSVVLSATVYNQNYGFVLRQCLALSIGIALAWVASRISYTRWRELATPFFIICLVLLIFLFIPGLGKATKGAVRWIDLGWFQLQPSELLKLGSILFFSAWLEKRLEVMKNFETMVVFVLLLSPIVFLMFLQRDLGTLIIILVSLGLLYFFAGASYTQIGVGLAAGVAMVLLLIVVEPYRLKRLTAFRFAGSDTLGAGYHINQASLAIGSGGWFGKGFGNGLQKYLYLPEPHTDSIFAIAVEELGFVRSSFVVLLVVFLAYRGYRISSRAPDRFSSYLAFGLTSMLFFQAVINIGAILGLIPLTGVPLPFISYGGTSLVTSLVAVGIITSISRYAYEK